MADYGIRVNGAPPTDGLAMLVDVVQTPLGTSGSYILPAMNEEQHQYFYHYLTFVYADLTYGKVVRPKGGSEQERCVLVEVEGGGDGQIERGFPSALDRPFSEAVIRRFRWETALRDAEKIGISIERVLVWRGVKTNNLYGEG